jgi:glucosamine-6-phosphate deaminase
VKLEIFPTPAALARAVADRLANVLSKRGGAVLLLPVGKTAVPVYRELARIHAAGSVSFRRATTFNLDELRVPPDDPESFRSFMERRLFSKVDLPRDRIRFLRGDVADPERECARYERQFAREGPADVAFVGMGVNGHVAYLEPGRSLPPRASLVRLSVSTRRGLAADGVLPVPREALTVGIETILSSRTILLVASGRRKARAVAAALEGPVTPRCPASFLSLHPRLELFLDPGAASLFESAPVRSPAARSRRRRAPA